MASARQVDDGSRLRWAAMLVAFTGHGAAIAALSLVAVSTPPAFSSPVLSVSLVSDETPAQEPPQPEVVKPRRQKQKAQPRPAVEPKPVVAEIPDAPPSSPALPAESATPEPLAAAAPESVPAKPLPVVPPRFNAAYLSNPAPAYPAASRNMGEQGKVFLSVLVTPQGEAQEVHVRTGSGFERLDLAALEAVRRWKFVPARQGDETVSAWVVVPILFSLRR
jgi:periplasmic protein TonB